MRPWAKPEKCASTEDTTLRTLRFLILCLVVLPWAASLHAQQLEPRRWGHLPVDTRFASLAYLYTDGEILLDPVLRIEDAKTEQHTLNAKFIYSFGLAGRTARIDADVPYVRGRWTGVLDGEFLSTEREGIADPRLRLSVLLSGAPPLSGEAFSKYHTSHPVNTIVGAAVSLRFPLGEYYRDRLINLGSNRFVLRPELGILHTRNSMSYELTGSMSLFEDNDAFWPGDSVREQDPLFLIQGHVAYTIKPGLWASISAGYGFGGESSINDVSRDDKNDNYFWALSVSAPVARSQSIKLTYAGARTNNLVGSDSDNLLLGWSLLF